MHSSRSHQESIYDSVEDFRAAFICTTNSINSYIDSYDELMRALQGCGRNPSNESVQRYWKRFNKKIGIEEFCDIAYNEQKISEKDIIDAFKLFDTNNDGFIVYKEFINIFNKEDNALNPNEVRRLLTEADLNKDNKLNYREFAKLVINTIERAKKHARKRMKSIISENYDDSKIRLKSKADDNHSHHHRGHRHHNDRDYERDRYSPIQPSRHSSLSFNSNFENDPLEFSKRKSNSRLSFADEIDDDRHHMRKKLDSSNNSNLKQMFKNELNRARSSESLRSSRQESKFVDSDNEKNDRKYRKDHHDEPDIRQREGSRSRNEKNGRDEKNREKDKESNGRKIIDALQIYDLKFQPISKIVETFKEPKNIKKWITKSIKGGFYLNDNLAIIQSNSYALDLKSESTIFFSIEPYKTQLHTNSELFNMDMSLLIVKDGKNLLLKGLTENKIKNKWCTKLDLKGGRYFLFPFTSGCHLKKRSIESTKNLPSLFKEDVSNKRTLSRQFKEALSVMFDLCDLDSSGRLSQDELNFYTILTSNETLMDDDWKFVGETVGFEKNELTREGFIQLYKLEAKRDDIDIKDINTRLANMGFNKSLTIDQSCPYKIEVSSEIDNFDILLGEIYNTKSSEEFLNQIIEAKGNAKPLKGFEDVIVFEYHNNYWSVIEVLNQSRIDLIVDINCTKSENCISNIRDMISSQKLKSSKSKIFMFLSNNNPNKEWIVRCSCSLAEYGKR